MMQILSLTPSTIVLLVVIIALMLIAVHRLAKRGMCDCHDGESAGCAGCAHSNGKKGCDKKTTHVGK